MTDRIRSLTVVLDRDYRDDDVLAITNAISMVKGVHSVDYTEHVVAMEDYISRASLASELQTKLYATIREFFDTKKEP